MNIEFEQLSGPERLAIVYAHPDFRAYLGLMLCIDKRLAEILQRTSEPLIAQMRVAWWNDVIKKAPDERPSGEPLLENLSLIESEYPDFDLSTPLLLLTSAWELLLAGDQWGTDALTQFAKQRSEAIFVNYAKYTGASTQELKVTQSFGEIWAINDLLQHVVSKAQADAVAEIKTQLPKQARLSRGLRSLSILTKNADPSFLNSGLAGFRLVWHAMTGR